MSKEADEVLKKAIAYENLCANQILKAFEKKGGVKCQQKINGNINHK